MVKLLNSTSFSNSTLIHGSLVPFCPGIQGFNLKLDTHIYHSSVKSVEIKNPQIKIRYIKICYKMVNCRLRHFN